MITIPPSGIVRTIPTLCQKGASRSAYERSLALLRAGRIEAVRFALNNKPKHEVLHLYILSAGRIIIRFTLVGFDQGEALKCWDGKTRNPGCWAICVDPSDPPREILMRGFRGYRYVTEPLW